MQDTVWREKLYSILDCMVQNANIWQPERKKQTTKTEIETFLLFLRAHQSRNVKNAEEK